MVCRLGLFPAIKSKSTGKIIRRMIQKSKIIIRGMNWRQAARYILMNRHLTSNRAPIGKFLPWKRAKGDIPSMKNRAVNDKKEDILKKWCFREVFPTETEMKVLASHVADVAEIGTRTMKASLIMVRM